MKILNEESPELVDIESLHEWPGNARTQDVDEIAEAITFYGLYAVLVVQQSTRNIIIGNHRWLGAKKAGRTRILVFWTDCSNEEGTRLNIWDNRIADKGSYDPIARIAQLEELSFSALGLQHSGFDADSMAAYIAANEVKVEVDEPEIPLGSGEKEMTVNCPNCGHEFNAKDHKARPSENPFS